MKVEILVFYQDFDLHRSFLQLSNPHPGNFDRLQRYLVNGLALRLVGHSGIDLGGGDVLVAQHMLDGIDAGASLDV